MIIRRNFWGLLTALIIAGVGAWLTRSQVYFRLLYLGGMLILVCVVWSWLISRSITVKRSARGLQQQLGQIFTEQFEVVNQSRLLCLWVEITDKSNLPKAGGSHILSWIGAHETQSYSSYTLLTRRGLFKLGPTEILAGDPFGFFGVSKLVQGDQNLQVVPYMVDIQGFKTPPGLLSGGKALRRKTLEVTPYAAGVREYFTGDSLNRIHWPTSARRDRLMVKEFEQDPLADVYIVLDAQEGIHFSRPDEDTNYSQEDLIEPFWRIGNRHAVKLPADTFEYCITAAGALARFFMRQGQAVGFISAGQQLTGLPAERDERQFGKILEILSFIASEGMMSLLELIELEVAHLPRGSSVVLVTSSWHDNSLLAVDTLLQRSLHPVVVFVDPASFDGQSRPDSFLDGLRKRGVGTTVVRYGDDLKSILESGLRHK